MAAAIRTQRQPHDRNTSAVESSHSKHNCTPRNSIVDTCPDQDVVGLNAYDNDHEFTPRSRLPSEVALCISALKKYSQLKKYALRPLNSFHMPNDDEIRQDDGARTLLPYVFDATQEFSLNSIAHALFEIIKDGKCQFPGVEDML
eukprot:scaffold7816_cov29-Tisochrysis_lutea.AAC.1